MKAFPKANLLHSDCILTLLSFPCAVVRMATLTVSVLSLLSIGDSMGSPSVYSLRQFENGCKFWSCSVVIFQSSDLTVLSHVESCRECLHHKYPLFNVADAIMEDIKSLGYLVAISEERTLSVEVVEQFYEEHKEKDFFLELSTFMST